MRVNWINVDEKAGRQSLARIIAQQAPSVPDGVSGCLA
jgi:hypothetical protein